MDRRQRKAVPEAHFHKFLRPGALARIRDSKIIAQSIRSVALTRLAPLSPSPPTQAVSQSEGEGQQLRFVSYRSSGPRYLLRKKLVASKTVYFVPSSPDLTDPFVDIGFVSDLVVAH